MNQFISHPVLIAFAVLAVCIYCKKYIHRFFKWLRYKVNPESFFLALLALSMAVSFGIVVIDQCIESKTFSWNILFCAFSTVFDLLECESQCFRSLSNLEWMVPILNILSITVPVSAAGAVIVFVFERFPTFILPSSEYVIFSRLEERSVLLAADMQKTSGKKVRFLFLRSRKRECSSDLLLQMQELPYQLYAYTETDLLTRHRGLRRKKLRFFFLEENTDENFDRLRQFLDAVEEKKLFQNPPDLEDTPGEASRDGTYQQELYLLSETASAPMLIDHLRKKLCENNSPKGSRKAVFSHTELRLLDRYRAVSYHLLQTVPLYSCAIDKKNHVLILGFGQAGQAFYRAAFSFCVMSEYETSFTLWDMEADRRYDALLQQLSQSKQDMPAKTQSFDIESHKMAELLDQSIEENPFTYIVVALGDDERNIQIAAQLKRYYRKKFWEGKIAQSPIICVNIENESKSSYAVNLFKDLDIPVGGKKQALLNPVFGTNLQTFSEAVLMPRGAWLAAQKLHSLLTGKNPAGLAFWSEYERRSSMASVCHAAYHVASVAQDNPDIPAEQYRARFQKRKDALINAEHQRWMNYVRSEGMQWADSDIVDIYREYVDSHVDIAGRLTPCLQASENLIQLHEDLSARFEWPKSRLTFRQRDELVVKNAWTLEKIITDNTSDLSLASLGGEKAPVSV